MRKIYKNNGILLSWMIVIMILVIIMTAIWLCPLYALWAQAEQSCSWHISTSLFSVMAKRELFSGTNPLLFNKENKRLEFCYLLSTQVIPYFIFYFFYFSSEEKRFQYQPYKFGRVDKISGMQVFCSSYSTWTNKSDYSYLQTLFTYSLWSSQIHHDIVRSRQLQ